MKKRQDILQAAEQLFYANGFQATSTDRICMEAGVSSRTLYHHFSSREALTAAIMEARLARFFAQLSAPEHPDALTHLFDTMGLWMESYGVKGCFFLKVWGEYADKDPALAEQSMTYRHAIRAYIAESISHQCGRDDRDLSDAIWMLFEGTLTTALILGASESCQAGKRAALQLISLAGGHQ